MKKRILFALGALLGSVLMFTACGDDEEDNADIRDCAVGNYNGTVSYYFLVNGALEEDEDLPSAESVNLTVAKDGTNQNAIQLNVDGDIFYGSKIESASNGFGFDIESQTYEDMTISGYNAGTVGTTQYNGVYLDDEKTLTVGFQVSMSDFVKMIVEECLESGDIESEEEAEEYRVLLNGACTEVGATAVVMVYEMNKR